MESEKSAGAQRGQRGSERGAFSLDPKDPAAPSGEAEESPAAEPEKGSSGQTEESQPKPEPDGSCGETSQGEEQEDARRNPTVPDAQEAQEDAQVRQPQEEKQPEETAADAQPEGETKETQSQNGSQQPGDSGGEHTAPEPPMGARARGWMGNTARSAALWISALWRISASALCWW